MGTDIHSVAQIREGDKFKTVAEQIGDDARNYGLFAKLADIRNYKEVRPIAEPRGLPDDFEMRDEGHYWTHEGQIEEVWIGDHTFSWFYLSELEQHQDDPNIKELCTELRHLADRHGVGGEDVRYVFGFDS
jgi:hypothetical protein